MNKKTTVSLLLGLGLALCCPTFVRDARAEDAAPSAATGKIAAELVKLVTPQETYVAMIDQVTQQMLGSIRQSGKQVPEDVEPKMKKAIMEVLPYAEMQSWSAEVYAARYTADELSGLMNFYKTPLGKKAARLQPEISGEVGKKLGPVLMTRMPAALKKVGLAP